MATPSAVSSPYNAQQDHHPESQHHVCPGSISHIIAILVTISILVTITVGMTSTRKASIMFRSAAEAATVVTISIIIAACSSFGSSLFTSTMSASEQRPCVLKDVVAVMGGGLDPSATVANGYAWVLVAKTINGKLFAEVPISNRRCKTYLGSNTKIVDLNFKPSQPDLVAVRRCTPQGDGHLHIKAHLF